MGINKPGWKIILKEQIVPLLLPFPPRQTLPCTAVPGDWAVWSFLRWKHVSSPCIKRWGCTEAYCLQRHRELCGERGVSSTAAWSFQPEYCLFSLECNILPMPSKWHCAEAGSAVAGGALAGKWSLYRQPSKSEAASEGITRTMLLNECFVHVLVAVAGHVPSSCSSPGS